VATERADRSSFLQHHFQDLEQQGHAARFGMWIFLATEILLFGGLFVGYMYYRGIFAESFRQASLRLDATLGTIETIVLITSSLFAVLSVYALQVGQRHWSIGLLALTITMGLTFLVLHGLEYAHEFREGIMPGAWYHFSELPQSGAILFFTLYFMLTVLHGAHVLAGVTVLGVAATGIARRRIDPAYPNPLEVVTLYWHLVDVIWIFLYPILYLAA
jgi:cytochrome c oxidase subunit 3